ncbi:MAG: hypothetical protein ACREUC_12665 [Steroidobacteraceae bacterium]
MRTHVAKLAFVLALGCAAIPALAALPIGKLKELAKLAEQTGVQELIEERLEGTPPDFDPLTPNDEQYEDDFDPAGQPDVPLQCAGSAECAECFEPAHARLNAVRTRFEKLRRIGAWTRTYKERAFTLGQAMGGMHGLAGLAWTGERIKLEKQFQSFESSYQDKYAELLGELEGSLRQIAACEESVYDEQGWYERFGFIYYNFMADRYRWP